MFMPMLLLLILLGMFYGLFTVAGAVIYRIRLNKLLENINTVEDFLSIGYDSFRDLVAEIFRRKGNKVEITNKCGDEVNGLILNDRQYVEIWRHALRQADVEVAVKLAWCMRSNSVYRGVLIVPGDFKHNTRSFCHKNVIECINGGQLLSMCKDVQKRKGFYEAG